MDYRPTSWSTYRGQEKLKDRLRIHIKSALDRKVPLEHVLLTAPPGYGKSVLASLISEEMGVSFEQFDMPIEDSALKRVVQMFEGVVLFDEIHRLTNKQQENLLPLVRDNYLQLKNGSRIQSGYLTIVAATTEPQQIIKPLVQRFPIGPLSGLLFDEYSQEEMSSIIADMARFYNIEFTKEQTMLLAKASGNIPRMAEGLVVMARDLQTTDVEIILDKCRVSNDGLTELHRRYIHALFECGGEAGIDLISAYLDLPKPIIVDLETFLIKKGYIQRGKQGRELLTQGYKVAQIN